MHLLGASFTLKGKSRPLKLLQKDIDVINMFGQLGKQETITENEFTTVQNFVCQMYGKEIATLLMM